MNQNRGVYELVLTAILACFWAYLRQYCAFRSVKTVLLYLDIQASFEKTEILAPSEAASRSIFWRTSMQGINEFSKTLTEMPVAALGTLIVLAAFALAAFAIHALAKNMRRR
jgi:hypothetical protein